MSNLPIKHHYIPKFHLRNWLNGNNELWRYTKPHQGLHGRRAGLNELGFEDHLYTLKASKEEDAVHLETPFFAKIDNFAAIALQKIIAEEELHPHDLRWWVIYLRSLMHRTPEDLARYKQEAQKTLNASFEPFMDDLALRQELRDQFELNNTTSSRPSVFSERVILKSLPTTILNEKILTVMSNLTWGIIDVSKAKHTLLISDSPIIRSNGLLAPNGHVAVPVTPSKICIGAPDSNTIEQISSSDPTDLVRICNQQIVKGARAFVAANDPTQMPFIQKYFAAGPRHYVV